MVEIDSGACPVAVAVLVNALMEDAPNEGTISGDNSRKVLAVIQA